MFAFGIYAVVNLYINSQISKYNRNIAYLGEILLHLTQIHETLCTFMKIYSLINLNVDISVSFYENLC